MLREGALRPSGCPPGSATLALLTVTVTALAGVLLPPRSVNVSATLSFSLRERLSRRRPFFVGLSLSVPLPAAANVFLPLIT